MDLLLVSDLHLDFHADGGAYLLSRLPRADAIVVAGDLALFRNPSGGATLADALRRLCARYPQVICVAGNHDFNYGSPSEVLASRTALRAELPGLHWLENDVLEIAGRRILGATLWYPYHGAATEARRPDAYDFPVIREFEPWVYEQNARSVAFLHEELRAGDLVVTHHLPSPQSLSEPRGPVEAAVFDLTDLSGLVRERRPGLWLHGHRHASLDYWLGDTRIVCNPYGLEEVKPNPSFCPGFVVDLV